MITPLGPDATGTQALRHHWRRRSGRLSDAAYLACGAVATVVAAVEGFDAGSDLAAMWFGLVNALLTIALLWRRRFPLLIALLCIAATGLANGYGLLAIGLFALAIRRRDTTLLATSAVGVAVMAAAIIVDGGHPVPAVGAAVLFVGFAIGTGSFVGARRDLVVSLRERAERAEAEQHLRADQARLSERARIAQEMHDVLAHKISLVALHAGGLEVRPDAGPEQVERAAGLIRITAREALEDLRDVLGVLRNDSAIDGGSLAPQPKLQDVPALVAASVGAGVPVSLDNRLPEDAAVPDAVGRTAYRVVQEALTNVHKHAHGTATTVTLSGAPGQGLELLVRNLSPVGTELAPLLPGAGMGLLGLGERVRLTGGDLTAGPDDGGFVVRASLPWPTDGR